MTEEMSGGLRHHCDEASGPELCGWIQQSSKKDRYCLEPTSASALRASYATKLQKQSSIYLDIADVVRDVEKVPHLMLVAVEGSGYKQARVPDAGVHRYLRRPATHDGKPRTLGIAVLLLPSRRSGSAKSSAASDRSLHQLRFYSRQVEGPLQRHRQAIDRPELLLRMLLVGYLYGVTSERNWWKSWACIWRGDGLRDWASIKRFRTARRSLRIGMDDSRNRICFKSCLRRWSLAVWRQDW